jgi:hypothetical protein
MCYDVSMFGRLAFLILALLATACSAAASSYTFTPGATIAMTGASDRAHFDVADDLYGYSESGAYLDTLSQDFS